MNAGLVENPETPPLRGKKTMKNEVSHNMEVADVAPNVK